MKEMSGGELLADRLRGDVLDVGTALREGVDLGRVDVNADNGSAGTAELQGQGQADVAEADDSDGFHKWVWVGERRRVLTQRR
jgi:hypothetical protein